MPKIYAFDNRTGAVNEAVTLHRPRTPTQASVEGFKHHPRISWRAGTPSSASASEATPAAASWGRIDHRGIRVPTDAEWAAMYPADGVYEALIEWPREHA